MSIKQITGYAGALLLLCGTMLPVASLNGHMISFIPLREDMTIEGGLWNWRDISFFAVTLLVLTVLSFYFTYRKKYPGLLFTGFLSLFSIIIIFMTILQVKSKYAGFDDIIFSLSSAGWIILIIAIGTLLFAGLYRQKNPH